MMAIIYSTVFAYEARCYSLFLLGPSPSLLAQSSSQNYVLTQALLNASGSNKVTEVQYHDGLGRPEIHVTTGLGISGNSILCLPR